MKVASLNIRYDGAPDGDFVWSKRRQRCLEAIGAIGADIFGFQEAVSNQIDDIHRAFPEMTKVACGRDDGVSKGESCLIMVSRKYRVLNKGTFWLSEKPFEPGSVSWGASCTRIATWVELEGAAGRLLVVNTHWDVDSELARDRSGKLIHTFLAAPSPGEWVPMQAYQSKTIENVIVFGDFNCEPGSQSLNFLGLKDTRSVLNQRAQATFQGFGEQPEECIDHIFCGSGLQPISFVTMNYEPPISDHNPIVATFPQW